MPQRKGHQAQPREVCLRGPPRHQALAKLKALLTNPLVLVPLTKGEALLLYIAAMTQVVSAAVVAERQEEGHALPIQRHVYFISEVLFETKTCYPHI